MIYVNDLGDLKAFLKLMDNKEKGWLVYVPLVQGERIVARIPATLINDIFKANSEGDKDARKMLEALVPLRMKEGEE